MRDLAVGAMVPATGEQPFDLFCREAAVGAPPDPPAEQVAVTGACRPWTWPACACRALANFITLLRTNMAHCGALRIDHAMSLLRLWWCPPGTTADHGALRGYPFMNSWRCSGWRAI